MSILYVNHIKADCKARFADILDVSDISAKTPQDVERHTLSRQLAAFSIAALARIEDNEAAGSVTDEQNDDGIDGFFYSEIEHTCYIVQSKWSDAGSGSIDVASILKFIQGVEHVVSGEPTFLGPKLLLKHQSITKLLGDSYAKFVLVIAYTGRAPLSADVQQPLDALLNLMNEDDELVSLQVLRQQELHKIVEQRGQGEFVDIDILLKEHGKIETPFRSHYGQMDVADIAGWAAYGDNLYARNIRGFKGSTDVNEAIINTLKTSPDNFIYFNNGITITCTKLKRKPLGVGSKASGVFECKGVSVVNGAQTVGSILAFLSGNQHNSPAKVMVRIISLEDCPVDFSSEVTRAVNTQNRIERRDFAALDPLQSKLRSDMLLSFKKEYSFRTGEQPPTEEDGCTLDEATISLACSSNDISLALLAKREVGKLYEDIHSAPYTMLFNESTSVLAVWRAIQVLRLVDGQLRDLQASFGGKTRLIAIHFNRMILHLVFRQLGSLGVSDQEWANALTTIQETTKHILEKTAQAVEALYPTAYVGSLFKNATKSKAIAAYTIPEPEAAQSLPLFE